MASVDEWLGELVGMRRQQRRMQAKADAMGSIRRMYWEGELRHIRSGPPPSRPARIDMRRADPRRRAELNEERSMADAIVMPLVKTKRHRAGAIIIEKQPWPGILG